MTTMFFWTPSYRPETIQLPKFCHHRITPQNGTVRMDLNKGSRFDGVASIFLRECAEQLSFSMSTLFTASMSNRYYPTAVKTGILTPICKSGYKKCINDYRGVNTVPNIAKVFDIVINDQLKLFVQPSIKSTQHGLLPNRTIETNLMELTTHIHRACETCSTRMCQKHSTMSIRTCKLRKWHRMTYYFGSNRTSQDVFNLLEWG